jgi:hypothetical protein
MRSTLHLARAAVGDPDLTVSNTRLSSLSSSFDIFDVKLPLPRFSGIPQDWVFAVLNSERVQANELTQAAILSDARNLIGTLVSWKLLLLISDQPDVRLADEFGDLRRDVFCLDYGELAHTKDFRMQPRFAPFVLAVKRRLSIIPELSAAFTPYHRNRPASGWRFVGREKQLADITNGNENLVVVGARRVGKTSLLLEAERRLRENGRNVYYVDVQECQTPREVMSEIVRIVSPRDAARAYKHSELFQESLLASLFRQLSKQDQKTVLLLDELGNVLARLPREDWSFMGLLRKYGASGGMKYVISCFQELFFRQQNEFEGPLINFAHTLRLDVFGRKEVEDFVLAPLDFWKPLGNVRSELLNLVISNVGSHPYFLQFFGHALFNRFGSKPAFDPLAEAKALLTTDLSEWFSSAVDEIFFRIPSPAVKYLFLRRCYEAEMAGEPLTQSGFGDDWIEASLASLGYRSTTRGRRNLMDSLEMHGLCTAVDYERSKKVVAAPLVYRFVRQEVPSFDKWLVKLGNEIDGEEAVWELGR